MVNKACITSGTSNAYVLIDVVARVMDRKGERKTRRILYINKMKKAEEKG